jgi:hypothetical protein
LREMRKCWSMSSCLTKAWTSLFSVRIAQNCTNLRSITILYCGHTDTHRHEDALPQPKQPGFFTERDLIEVTYSSTQSKPYSANECSISLLEAR